MRAVQHRGSSREGKTRPQQTGVKPGGRPRYGKRTRGRGNALFTKCDDRGHDLNT